jgi:hypothetical protein
LLLDTTRPKHLFMKFTLDFRKGVFSAPCRIYFTQSTCQQVITTNISHQLFPTTPPFTHRTRFQILLLKFSKTICIGYKNGYKNGELKLMDRLPSQIEWAIVHVLCLMTSCYHNKKKSDT